ncbi:MAG: choice-of-anchor Q domain-containing protein [Dokdonella sp.]
MFKQTLSALILAMACTPALAIDYIVTRSDDPNPDVITLPGCRPEGGCSLRQAILASNKRVGADRIVLRRSTTYTLSRTTQSTTVDGRSGPLLVTDELEIVGTGSDRNRIEWQSNLHHSHTVLVHGVLNTLTISPPLALRDVTIANGRGEFGGCLRTRNGTELGLYGVVVENCRGRLGGGLSSGTPSLVIYESYIRNNLATQDGGGIHFSSSVTVIATRAAVLNNHANRDGGGIAAEGLYLAGSSSGTASVVWRSASGPSDFWDNRADGNGGAIAVGLASTLNMFRLPANPIRSHFLRNSAGATGGAISMKSYKGTLSASALTLEDTLLLDNVAAEGGAIATSGGQSLIVSSEFQENHAQSGAGGAVLFSAIDDPASNVIRQSSFNANSASLRGGAIASVCQPLVVRDGSLWGNVGPSGSAVYAAGQTALTSVTTASHGSQALTKGYHTACGNQPFQITNSVIAESDRCSTVVGGVSSGGGNFYSASAPGCNFINGLDFMHSVTDLGLRADTFGGERLVLGWDNDGQVRPQVNAGISSQCSSVDGRGFPRNDGACDSGAFEQQTPSASTFARTVALWPLGAPFAVFQS